MVCETKAGARVGSCGAPLRQERAEARTGMIARGALAVCTVTGILPCLMIAASDSMMPILPEWMQWAVAVGSLVACGALITRQFD